MYVPDARLLPRARRPDWISVALDPTGERYDVPVVVFDLHTLWIGGYLRRRPCEFSARKDADEDIRLSKACEGRIRLRGHRNALRLGRVRQKSSLASVRVGAAAHQGRTSSRDKG